MSGDEDYSLLEGLGYSLPVSAWLLPVVLWLPRFPNNRGKIAHVQQGYLHRLPYEAHLKSRDRKSDYASEEGSRTRRKSACERSVYPLLVLLLLLDQSRE